MAESRGIVETRDNPNTSYEKSDWPVGKIGLVFLATFILLVVTPFILMWGFPHSLSRPEPGTDDRAAAAPPAGRPFRRPRMLSRAGEGAAQYLLLGRSRPRPRPHPDRGGDEAGRRTRHPRLSEGRAMKRCAGGDCTCRRGACDAGRASGRRNARQRNSRSSRIPGPSCRSPSALDDEQGRARPLAAFFTGKPVVLVLEYLHCRTFCGLTLRGLIAALDGLPLDAGRDFRLVAISIDPRDTPEDAAAAKADYLAAYHHPDGRKRRAFSDRAGGGGAPDRRDGRVPVPIRRDARPVSSIPPVSSSRARKAGSADTCSASTDPPPSWGSGLPTAAQGQAFDVLRPILLLCHAAGRFGRRLSVPIMAAFGIANLAAIAVLIAVFAAILRRRRG